MPPGVHRLPTLSTLSLILQKHRTKTSPSTQKSRSESLPTPRRMQPRCSPPRVSSSAAKRELPSPITSSRVASSPFEKSRNAAATTPPPPKDSPTSLISPPVEDGEYRCLPATPRCQSVSGSSATAESAFSAETVSRPDHRRPSCTPFFDSFHFYRTTIIKATAINRLPQPHTLTA